ncbi:MAG TPA: hypothetical protein VFI31_17725 [Pirellulales bacterium]|nr:hypothetical protein [Pirellulales bacterium]
MTTQTKVLVLTNGLRDQLGHYYETSVSVADAARKLGFRPILATHVDCRRELLPFWLETHSLFHTDHWMREAPAPEASIDGGAPALRQALGRGCGKAYRTCRRATWLAERSLYYLLPPLWYDLLRFTRYACVPRIASREACGRLAAKLRRSYLGYCDPERARLYEQAAPWPRIVQAIAAPSASPKLLEAAERLLPLGLGQELDYALWFYEDLERFLAAADAGPSDQVWLGTAHAREVLGVRLAVERMGSRRSPAFHLEFRHAPFARDATSGAIIETPQTQLERSFLSLHAEWPGSDRIRCYTDSARLSEDYESLVDLPFDVLPLPFRAHLISPHERQPGSPVTLAYFGEARDEKGFHWLPDLAAALADDYLLPGKAKFLIQSNVSQPQHNPRSCAALRRLKRRAPPGIELLALDGTLSPEDYYSLVSQADVALLPYAPEIYHSRTSGALGEALAAGAVPVVPSRTWLSDQLSRGCGETFDDFAGFVGAVKRVLDNFESYAAKARRRQATWLEVHSPEALVKALTSRSHPELKPAAAA